METQNSKDESVRRQLLALANMSRPELCEKWRDFYGNEPPNSSKEFLCRRLSYRVQELFYGGLDADLQVVLTSDAPKARPKKSVLRDGAKILFPLKTGTQWNLFNIEHQTVKTNGDKECMQYRSPSDFFTIFSKRCWGMMLKS